MMHVVRKNETIGSISSLYYGNTSYYNKILQANPKLKNRFEENGDIVNDNILIEGESVRIPIQPKKKNINESSDIAVYLGGDIFEDWTALSMNFSMDRIASTFSLGVAYDENVPFSKNFRRFTYPQAEIFYKGDLIISGMIPDIDINLGEDANTISLAGYSATGLLAEVELTPEEYPRRFVNMSLASIADQLLGVFALAVEVDDSAAEKANELYNEIAIGETEKIGAFLIKLAKDRSLLLKEQADGGLFIYQFEKGKKESFSIKGDSKTGAFRPVKASFKGSKIYSDYYLIKSGEVDSTVENSNFSFPISIFRPKVLTQDEDSEQSMNIKIENEAKKALAAAQNIQSSFPRWENDNDELILPGQVFTVNSKKLQIPGDERHVVRSCTHTANSSGTKQVEFDGVLEASISAT